MFRPLMMIRSFLRPVITTWSAGQIGQITCIEPTVRGQNLPGGFRISQIFGHDTGPTHMQHSAAPLGQRLALLVANLDLVPGNDRATEDEFLGLFTAGALFHRNSRSAFREGVGIDPVDLQSSAQRRKADGQRAFSHAVGSDIGLGIEACRREKLSKTLEDIRPYRLGSGPGDTPGAQVVLFDLSGADPPRTEGIPEGGTVRDCCPVFRNQCRPETRAHGKITGAQVIYGKLGSHWREKKTHQTHIVVKGKP